MPPPNKVSIYNIDFLGDANVCIANSNAEADTLRRDSPRCNAKTVYWSPGFADEWSADTEENFPDLVGLKPNDYLLQVGRLETRKNQFATVLATKDIDVPLVFIATNGEQPDYEKTVGSLAKKYRKGKTIIVSERHASQDMGNVQIIQMPGGNKLSTAMLKSAYSNCAVHIHPAFYELPGYTYLESLSLKKPTVGSSWCSISEYLKEFSPNKDDDAYCGLMYYSKPYDINSIKDNTLKALDNTTKPSYEHEVFTRTKLDVATDVVKVL